MPDLRAAPENYPMATWELKRGDVVMLHPERVIYVLPVPEQNWARGSTGYALLVQFPCVRCSGQRCTRCDALLQAIYESIDIQDYAINPVAW